MNTAVAFPQSNAFAFSLLRSNSAANAVDAKFQMDAAKKGENTQLSSDCCTSNNYGKPS